MARDAASLIVGFVIFLLCVVIFWPIIGLVTGSSEFGLMASIAIGIILGGGGFAMFHHNS